MFPFPHLKQLGDGVMGDNFEYLENMVAACVEKVEHNDYNVNELNTAASPILFFYFGNTVNENVGMVYNLINANWRRNARYVKHIGVQFVDNQFVVTDLTENVEYECSSDKDVMNELVRKVLEAPIGTFSNNNIIRTKFVLLSSDDNSDRYLEFARTINTDLTTVMFKDLYLLLNEGGSVDDTGKTKALVKSIHKLEKNQELEAFNNIIILSDRLKNGQFIQKHEKKTSYRVIADAVLIMDSDDRNKDLKKQEKFYKNKEYRYKTLSHRIVRKPSFEITCVIFKTILQIVLNEKAKEKMAIAKSFENEQFEERYFANVLGRKFPKGDDFRYLPYSPEGKKNLENRFHSDKRNGQIHIDESLLDRETYSCYELFFNENYINNIESEFKKDEFTAELLKYYTEKYSYKDIKEYFKYEDIVDIACETKKIVIGEEHSKSVYSALARFCFLKAQNYFFELIRPSYLETMTRLYNLSINFEKVLFDALNKVSSMYFLHESGINQSIEDYYSDYTNDFYLKNKQLFKELFTINVQDEKQLSDVLGKIFGKMILNDFNNQLTCGFKEELNHRLGTAATPAARENLIRNELQPNIDDYTRIHIKNDSIRDFYDAYLCSPNGDFINNLGDAEIYSTNDENVFEHLKFYVFDSIADIYGNEVEG